MGRLREGKRLRPYRIEETAVAYTDTPLP